MKRIVQITLLYQLFSIYNVTADYCEFGVCDDKEHYCCGKNKCCEKTLDQWFFWAGVLLIVFTIAVALGWRYTKLSKRTSSEGGMGAFHDCKYKLLEQS